jgi:hypothetical protein
MVLYQAPILREIWLQLCEVLCYTANLRMLISMLFLLLMVVGDVA